jgi:hypothetical protein
MHPTTANPSLAAQTAAVTGGPAAYLVGGNGYLFRFVGATLTQPTSGCTNFSGNYGGSGVQLIGAPGPNVAVGLECRDFGQGPQYFAGYTSGYQGNKFPELQNHTATSFSGNDADRILLQLYYDPRAATVKITAKDLFTGRPYINDVLLPTGNPPGVDAQYYQAVLGGVVPNPLPAPPPLNTSEILQQFNGCSVTTYAHFGIPAVIKGTGIKPPPKDPQGVAVDPWGVQVERAFNGTKKIADVSALRLAGTAFHVRIFGPLSAQP